MSISTGFAPAISIAATVATAVCDTVTTAHPARYRGPQRQRHRVRAVAAAHRVRRTPSQAANSCLERPPSCAEDIPARSQRARDRGVDFRRMCAVAGAGVGLWHDHQMNIAAMSPATTRTSGDAVLQPDRGVHRWRRGMRVVRMIAADVDTGTVGGKFPLANGVRRSIATRDRRLQQRGRRRAAEVEDTAVAVGPSRRPGTLWSRHPRR